MMCGIYTITCKINGRKYVRSTDDNKERWGKHLTQLRGNYITALLCRGIIINMEKIILFLKW